ncbi:MAG: hypothetical protein PF487_10470, partial [Bacteroidales bacterium]|nr:hypothetical protein [Bacteroidales bacterium]
MQKNIKTYVNLCRYENNPFRYIMKLSINTYQTKEIVKGLAKKLNTEVKSNYLEELLDIPQKYGKGRILGFDFSDGVGLLLFDCTLKKDCTLLFNKTLESPLLFNFSVESTVYLHYYNSESTQHSLKSLHSTITACPKKTSESFLFKGNKKLVYACVLIDRKKFTSKIDSGLFKMSKKMKTIFSDTNGEKLFFNQTKYTLSSSKKIQEIIQDQQTGLERSVFLEGITLELLSIQINQLKNTESTSKGY